MKKILTIILDGFGLRNEVHGNAVKLAKMPNFVSLWNNYPHCQLMASEQYVGLTKHQMGNSEVGHQTIGAGRLVKQNFMQIEDWFLNDEISKNLEFKKLVDYAKSTNKPIHMMGLLSDGGIHSHIEFFERMIEVLHKNDVSNVFVHAISDGRDTETTVSYKYIKKIDDLLKKYNMGSVVSVCGRYYAMDRDKKWDRTKLYYDAEVNGRGAHVRGLADAIEYCYKKNITDEFLPPIILEQGKPIQDGDILLWMNYRPDRAKQILRAITDSSFDGFENKLMPNLKCYSIYPIDEAKNGRHFLEHVEINNSLGVYLSNLGLSQARIAETEKYAHVTYFFDGGKELSLEKCDRFLVPSPKVATYDMKPEMSCYEVTEKCVECLENDYDFILMNYANPDMVGHTGNLEATVKALENIDKCLGKVLNTAFDNFYTVVLLSDHGNCDYMLDENDNPVTTHSLYPVPFIMTDKKLKLRNGDLTSVAPTILKYMDIAIPKEMKDTKNLIVE